MLFFNIDPKGFKTRVNGKIWSIDIYVPEFNLGIEFDGSYWHKDKRALDKLKTEKLKCGFQKPNEVKTNHFLVQASET